MDGQKQWDGICGDMRNELATCLVVLLVTIVTYIGDTRKVVLVTNVR